MKEEHVSDEEWNKTPEEQLSEMETDILAKKELRVMIIKMIKELVTT